MLVDSKKMKQLRQSKNWTQQHLADVCDLSMRTIQRVEKDGVASNETISSYAAVFETQASEIVITTEEFDATRSVTLTHGATSRWATLIFVGGFGLGIGLAWLIF